MLDAAHLIYSTAARAVAPRRRLTVSQWADAERYLSGKDSTEPGRWNTSRNPPLREPMDCLSVHSRVRDVVMRFPIQSGKSAAALNAVGYCMDHNPGPVMVCLPGEVSMNKWVQQKLNPMIDVTPAVQRALTSVASRDSANTRTFKDFVGGQLYLEHAGSPSRLKSTSVRTLIVDELDEFAANLPSTGDDPVEMLDGRTSAFPSTYKRLYISTPQMLGSSRIEMLWEKSDQRRYHVACPHCGHPQHLEWAGLHWQPESEQVWYVCRECGACIEEHEKTAMIAEADRRNQAGDATVGWVPEHPGRKIRGYTINCLYYQIGLGPRWAELAERWRDVQGDPRRLKVFVNDRLAEAWEDPAMRSVKQNVIVDRAEPYELRTAPEGVLAITAGVDTQDNRLAVQIVGWGRGMRSWVLHYEELFGDPWQDTVWNDLTDLLNRPIPHPCGAQLVVEAMANDIGGHRAEAVKNWVRRRLVRRPLAIFGATSNNAQVLGRGKFVDVTYRGKVDARGVAIHAVGTVGIKHTLFARLSADHDKEPEDRMVHFSDQLGPAYFAGLTSEVFNPAKNRFEKRRGGGRNEALDTYVYAYVAAHHPELRLHRATLADWAARETRIIAAGTQPATPPEPTPAAPPIAPAQPTPRSQPAKPKGGRNW